MKPDLFLFPRIVSEINLCTIMKPQENFPYRQEPCRKNYGISYHITTATRSIFKNTPDGFPFESIRPARTIEFLPKGSIYETYTTKVGFSSCINFQLAEAQGIPMPQIPFFIEVTEPVRIERLMTDAAKLWREKSPGYLYECGAHLQELLGYMESQINCSYFTSAQARMIERAIAYINENFAAERITVAELAQNAGVSDVYFRRRFKEYTGMTPSQYIRNRRIEWGKELIVSSMFTMEAVASQAGFSDVSHFCHEFRRCTGMSPTEYRKQVSGS